METTSRTILGNPSKKHSLLGFSEILSSWNFNPPLYINRHISSISPCENGVVFMVEIFKIAVVTFSLTSSGEGGVFGGFH